MQAEQGMEFGGPSCYDFRDATPMPRQGVAMSPHLVAEVRRAHAANSSVDSEQVGGDDDEEADVAKTPQEMVEELQTRARVELASYYRVMCMRLEMA